jgi:ABC-type Fe3+-hydroxamate transport system substrate-binding protein
VITNGFGSMQDYSAQIPVKDRWSIIAYVRALQLSQHASLADVPEEERQQWQRWSSLSAVKYNRLVLVPSVLVDRPGPRIVEGLELLAKAIHPEAFTGESPKGNP